MQCRLLLCLSLSLLVGCNAGTESGPSAESNPSAPHAVSSSNSDSSTGFVTNRNGASGGSDWPQWRGPNGDGISPESDWNDSFTSLPTRWQTSVGTGYSSVSVAGGKLYTMGHVDGEDIVHCLDASTGESIWEHRYTCELVDNLHDGGPACTPTVAGDVVLTVSKEGHFFCLSAETGKVVWQTNFVDDLGVPRPDWGYSCSPLVWDDLVYVDGGCVAAYDLKTGKVTWKSSPYRPGYGSVARMIQGERKLVTVLNNDGLNVFDALSGEQIANKKWETSFLTSATTPIVHDDTIFISTGYNQGCALFKLTGNQLEYVYDNRNMSNHMNNCVLWQGYLYGVDGNSHNARNCTLNCMEYATGELKWKHRGLGTGSVMIAGEKLMVLSDQGKLVVAPISTKGFEPTGEADILSGTCWTVPVLSHGLLYARNSSGDLVCVEMK